MATGVCPECGTAATRSLEAVIDPATHRLPPLLAPRLVGSGLACLGWLFLVGGVMLAVNRVLISPPVAEAVPNLARFGAPLTLGTMIICGLLGWRPILQLWPTPGTVDPRRGRSGLGLLSIGLVLWSGSAVAIWSMGSSILMLQIILVSGVFCLEGLRRILIEVGTRSRLFRTDRIRRQRVRDLIAGILFIQLGVFLTWWELLRVIGYVITIVAALLVLVGLVYLCMNLLWIRQSLLSPPRRLREYLDPPSGP